MTLLIYLRVKKDIIPFPGRAGREQQRDNVHAARIQMRNVGLFSLGLAEESFLLSFGVKKKINKIKDPTTGF